MGIDAEMYILTKERLNEESLKKASYIFGSAFRWNLSFYDNEKPIHYWKNKYDLYRDILETNRTLEINLSGRYYGKGYERGPILTYISMAELIERLIPTSEIYYGGDCDVELELFDKECRDKYLNHFIKNAHDPYRKAFHQDIKKTCPTCEYELIQSGWGGNYAYLSCPACGWVWKTKDGVIEEGRDVKGFV